MPYNSKVFGIVISRERTRRNMSQETLSALAGIARSHLAMLEGGRKTVRLDTLWQISEALSIKPGELISMVESEMQHEKENID